MKKFTLIMIVYIFILFFIISKDNGGNYNYETEFKTVKLQFCNKIFYKLEDKCMDMVCRDILVNSLAECWKKSMNSELNKRLLKLKDANIAQFQAEMDLQKNFNQATQNLCRKDCGSNGMKGLSYNFCRIDAYKYRILQAFKIDKNQLSLYIKGNFELKKSRKEKIKDTKFYKTFLKKLCKMPKDVWNEGSLPVDCQKKFFIELNSFEFTDDICDLS